MYCTMLWEQAEESSTNREKFSLGPCLLRPCRAQYLETEQSFLLGSVLLAYLLIYLIPGIKPRAFHTLSTSPTPELHPSLPGVLWDNDLMHFKYLSVVLF